MRAITKNIGSRTVCLFLAVLILTVASSAQTAVTIVSAASYEPGVTPDSLASAFGDGLSEETASAVFDDNGELPLQLGGVRVEVGGVPARLLFVSPGQVNFLVPADAPLGSVEVVIESPTGTATGTVAIAAVSPALFFVNALRLDRGALLDGSTWLLEPFSGLTILETSDVIDTRISLFGTGWRNAPQGSVEVYATGPWSGKRPLEVEYAGVAPGFAGLDQINVKLPDDLRQLGLISVVVATGGRDSNPVSLVMNAPLDWKGSFPTLYEHLKSAGDDGTALVRPVDVAWAGDGSIYIADPGAHAIFRLSAEGILTRFAGTGSEGNSGDGGAATAATLSEPVAVDADAYGNVYIADRAANRIRVVDKDGVIRAFAGNGTAGDGGDGQSAADASLNGPSDVLVAPGGVVLIADTLNHRIRAVTSDGRIQTLAGTGEQGDGVVWGEALCAALSSPTSLAVGIDGTVFVVDSGSGQILRILPNGQITSIGGDLDGAECSYCSVADFPLSAESRIATDAAGRIYVSHPEQGRVYVIDSSGVVRHLAGNPAGSDDPVEALQARIQRPLGLNLRLDGSLIVADADGGRARLFAVESPVDCSTVTNVLFDRPVAVSGENVLGTVHLACPVAEALTVALETSSGALVLPNGVIISAGSDTGHFTATVGALSESESVTLQSEGAPIDVLGRILLHPASDSAIASLSLYKDAILAGAGTFAVLRLGAPAPAGGLSVDISADGLIAANTIQVPEGVSHASFSLHAAAGHAGGTVTVSASVAGESASAELVVVPAAECPDCACLVGTGPSTGTIGSLTINPATVTTQTSGTGTVILQQPAGPNGVQIVISTNHPSVLVPLTILIPEGETTGTFPVVFIPVEEPATVTVTATSDNSVSTTVNLNPPQPALVALQSFTVAPESVAGGEGATGTVTLAAPAPANGARVTFSSDNSAATIPASILIPSGGTSASVNISTSVVAAPVTVALTATSLDSVAANLEVVPPDASQGQIGSIAIAPNPVTSGATATGTVVLTAPAGAGGVLVTLSSNNENASVPQSIVIPVGETSGTFAVTTSPVSEQATATITAASANSIATNLTLNAVSAGQGQIGSITISPNPVKSGGSATGTVVLASPAPAAGVLINLSSNSGNVTVPPSIVIPGGETTGTFPVTTTPVAAPETVTVTATSANSVSTNLGLTPPDPGAGTIGTLSISPNPVISGNSATGTITLAEPAGPGGVTITLSSNNSHATVPASLVIPAGSSSGTFPVTTTIVTEQESAGITATSANQLSVTLTLNPPPATQGDIGSVSISPNPVTSGNSAVGTVTLNSPAPAGGVLVTLASNNANATVPASIVIPAGASSGTFNVQTSPVASNQTATVTATSANTVSTDLGLNSAGAGQGTLGGISISPNPVTSGQGATGTVTLSEAAPTNGILVTLSSNNPNATVPPSIVIPTGQTTGTFPVSTTGVNAPETATITATSSNSVNTNLTLNAANPSEVALANLTLSPNPVKSGNPSTGTVFLASAAPAGGALVNLSSTNPNATVPTSVVIPAGQTSGTFQVTTTPVVSTQTATIAANSLNGVSAVLTMTPLDPGEGNIGSVAIIPNPVVSGNGATGTVTLGEPAPAGGILVTLSSNNPNASVPASIVIPAGLTSGTFPVSTSPVGTDQTATITAVSANSVSTDLALESPGAGQATLGGVSVSPNPVISGSGAVGTVTLAQAAPVGGVLVTLGSNNPNAAVPPSIVIPAGETSGNFSVTTTASGEAQSATITAASANSVSTDLALNPPGPSQGNLGTLSVSPNPVASGSAATGTVTLAAPAPVGGVLVNLSSNNPNATVPATLTIPAGSTSGTFPVTTTAVDATETAQITAQSANTRATTLTLNPPNPSEGTINSLNLSPNPVTSGAPSTGTVTLSAAAPVGGVLVNLSSNHANATVPSTLLIPAGSSSGTFTVTTVAATSQQTATITAQSANTVNATLTMNAASPESAALASFTLSPTLVTGGGTSTGTVTLAAPAGPLGVLVTLSSNNSAATVPPSVTILSGQAQGTFTVNTTTVSSLRTATITATSTGSLTANLQIDVESPCVESLNLTANLTNILTGQGLLNAVVTLTGPAPMGGSTVNLVGANGQLGQIFIPQGQTQGSVQITVANLLTLVGSTLRAVLGDCPGVEVLISLDVPVLGSLQVPASLKVGNSGTGTVTLLEPAPAGGALVTLNANGEGLLAGLLNLVIGVNVPGTVLVPEGQLSANFQIQTSILNGIAYGLLGNLLGDLNVAAQLNASHGGIVSLTK